MSTYARINSLTLKVDNVIVAEDSIINNRSDYDLWIKTSKALTKKIAAVGDTYTVATSSFKTDSPFASWVFNETTWEWEAPTARPDGYYDWNEVTTSWIELD
jgi:hypothetical protein